MMPPPGTTPALLSQHLTRTVDVGLLFFFFFSRKPARRAGRACVQEPTRGAALSGARAVPCLLLYAS